MNPSSGSTSACHKVTTHRLTLTGFSAVASYGRRPPAARGGLPQRAWKLLRAALMFVSLAGATYDGVAASFNCDGALTAVEEMICSDQNLSQLDEVLASTYKWVDGVASGRDLLLRDQRQWLRFVRNHCADKDCLFSAYQKQIDKLETDWTNAMTQKRSIPDPHKPFEGHWENCVLHKGERICSSYVLVQTELQICGEWQDWATYRIYEGEMIAVVKSRTSAGLAGVCGSLGSRAKSGCTENGRPDGAWNPKQSTMILCDGRLYEGEEGVSCEKVQRASGYLHRPLTTQEQDRLASRPWLRKVCIGGR